jgi:hypothetical protein
MSSLQEIELAIRGLSEEDRAKLITDLPALIPELDGDKLWEFIALDPRPRPKLDALIAKVDAQYRRDPNSIPIMRDADFES